MPDFPKVEHVDIDNTPLLPGDNIVVVKQRSEIVGDPKYDFCGIDELGVIDSRSDLVSNEVLVKFGEKFMGCCSKHLRKVA